MELYKDKTQPEAARVEDLLSRMTVDEKLAQLAMGPDLPVMKQKIADGSYPEEGYPTSYSYKAEDIALYNEVQKYQIEHTRLGIPLLLHGESLHGFMCRGATVFPQAATLGATFDPALVGEIANIAGREAYIHGVRQTYAPNLDISRDPRWGRVEENYGEDPYLTGRMGAAYVKNLQSNHVASSPKHYLAHGTPECGINIGPVHAGEREVREVMLEPFAAAFTEAKAMSVMPAYSELDGVPIHASHWACTELLRGELGFDGYAVSDFGAVSMLCYSHHVVPTPEDAAALALASGIDHEAGARACMNAAFCDKVRSGAIPMEQVDEAVRRTLRIKFRLGLFEDPYAHPERMAEVNTAGTQAVAYRAALESAVLLENRGALPLAGNVAVALVGPNADEAQLGDYCAPDGEAYSVTLRAALTERLGAEKVLYAPGCNLVSFDEDKAAAAKAAMDGADVVIVVLGDSSKYHGGRYWGDDDGGNAVTCGEGFDNSTLTLPEAQMALLRDAKMSGKPVITVLECGRPYCLGVVKQLSDAILWAGYPGQMGGKALADLIFGDAVPSGRLNISLPRSVGTLPCYYNHKPTARGYYRKPGSPTAFTADGQDHGRDYVFEDPAALYPFGYGLSYTTFAYSDLTVSADPSDRRADVTVKVTNTGGRAADETVLVFLKQHVCPVTPFVRRLRAFTRVNLAPGESKLVTFTLTSDDFAYVDEHMKKAPGAGRFTAFVGGQAAEFTM